MQRNACLDTALIPPSRPHARRSLEEHRHVRMTPHNRGNLSDAAIKTIVGAVVEQLGAAYGPATGKPLDKVLERLDKIDVRLEKIVEIDVRLEKIEEQTNEHLPLLKSLHSALSTGKGFGKFLTWLIALAAASATAWTAIKGFYSR